MAQEVTNFARFFTAFNRLQYHGDKDEFKRSVVSQYTWGRTESLKEMTRKEYDACCAALEKLSGIKDSLRLRRSICLKLMQKLGVDTTNWARINDFSRHPRIAGKDFAKISIDELLELEKKLRSILRKGGLKPKEGEQDSKTLVYTVPLNSGVGS
jgi:hypothetical protein